jgi:hypothetical protein
MALGNGGCNGSDFFFACCEAFVYSKHMSTNAPKKAYVVGTRPPQDLSDKAKKQLSNMRPSKKATALIAKASSAKVVVSGFCTCSTQSKPKASRTNKTTQSSKSA